MDKRRQQRVTTFDLFVCDRHKLFIPTLNRAANMHEYAAENSPQQQEKNVNI